LFSDWTLTFSAGRLVPIIPRTTNVDAFALKVDASASPRSPTLPPPPGKGGGAIVCPKASCIMIVPPNPRLAGNNNKTLALMAAIIGGLSLSPKKAK
ncbi:MAG: hypothetical protein M3093_03310, partial [Thermoproteota archaeon]|nr:hypothetical protein [Thermoproteota archaeon]